MDKLTDTTARARTIAQINRYNAIPGSKVGDVDNGWRILLKQPNSSELIGLQFSGCRDHKCGGGVDISDKQGEGECDGSAEEEERI